MKMLFPYKHEIDLLAIAFFAGDKDPHLGGIPIVFSPYRLLFSP